MLLIQEAIKEKLIVLMTFISLAIIWNKKHNN